MGVCCWSIFSWYLCFPQAPSFSLYVVEVSLSLTAFIFIVSFPLRSPFHWPRVAVYLNHLPAFIFRFSSLPLLRGSLAVIILAPHISFPPFLCPMDSQGALVKAAAFGTAISSRHRPQGLVSLPARPSPGAAARAPHEGLVNVLRDRLWCPGDMAAPLEGLAPKNKTGKREQSPLQRGESTRAVTCKRGHEPVLINLVEAR